jgi:O-antigen/teichoic acid export membrane protein
MFQASVMALSVQNRPTRLTNKPCTQEIDQHASGDIVSRDRSVMSNAAMPQPITPSSVTPNPGQRIPSAIAYTASVAFDKGFSIFTIPLVASYLAPQEYGRLDVAVSLIEFTGLVLALGVADTLVRFASTTQSGPERQACAARYLGTALVLAVCVGGLLQLVAPWLAAALHIQIGLPALRLGLAGATVAALIETPLIWMRLNQRSDLYLGFIVGRSVSQVALMWLVLRAGWGSDGLVIANGSAMLLFSACLLLWQLSSTGIAISRGSLQRVASYGLPLVGAGLAMFALGNGNRWFLSGRVSDGEIAFLGLAFKLALAAPLLLQPFALWWNAQRIAALSAPGGLEKSATAWGLGFSVLTLSCLAVALGGPILIQLALPPSYASATIYLPFAVLVCFCNELNTLCNVGAYARSNGFYVFGANASGAAVAIIGYALLVPQFGVAGVLAAMIAGHLTRLVVFVRIGRNIAPIRYPALPALAAAALAVAAVYIAPDSAVARIGWSAAAVLMVAAVLLAFRLITIPGIVLPKRLRSLDYALGR